MKKDILILSGLLLILWSYQGFDSIFVAKLNSSNLLSPDNYNEVGFFTDIKNGKASNLTFVDALIKNNASPDQEVPLPFKEVLLMGLVGLFWAIKREKTINSWKELRKRSKGI